jgi:hypothetical protein
MIERERVDFSTCRILSGFFLVDDVTVSALATICYESIEPRMGMEYLIETGVTLIGQ